MSTHRRKISNYVCAGLSACALGTLTMSAETSAQTLPTTDLRAVTPPRNLDTNRTFPTFASRKEWEDRRAFIRQQILISCGLYPLPRKTPLRARVFDRVLRDGYSIEKVAIQTYPGFYLAGNLYRPLAKSGKHPGVLVAHGHWQVGRMANTEDGSIPARAITFARQGYVAFTYDMVGYNDTRQIPHTFANTPRHWLWGVSLMGLQSWNSIRALDFLASLSDVDTSRLAITGESGGGTQTMILGAIDDRLAAVGPCVMVSHTMQGGCLCENAPGLRVDFSNVEVAAAAAPKFQCIVGATGDWTRDTMTMEGPSVERIYRLEGVPDKLKYVRFDYGHNINKTSREAVYAFFGKTLLGEPDAAKLTEPPYTMEPVENLRVFPDDKPLPTDAKTADLLTDFLIEQGQTALEQRKPHDQRSLASFKKHFARCGNRRLQWRSLRRNVFWRLLSRRPLFQEAHARFCTSDVQSAEMPFLPSSFCLPSPPTPSPTRRARGKRSPANGTRSCWRTRMEKRLSSMRLANPVCWSLRCWNRDAPFCCSIRS